MGETARGNVRPSVGLGGRTPLVAAPARDSRFRAHFLRGRRPEQTSRDRLSSREGRCVRLGCINIGVYVSATSAATSLLVIGCSLIRLKLLKFASVSKTVNRLGVLRG